VLDRAAAWPRTLHEVTRLAIAGGVDAVVCRIKNAAADEMRGLARPVRELCRERAVPFVMSHEVDLAVELRAEAVHLGLADPPLSEVLRQVEPGMAVGYSAHSISEAREQLEAGAAYVFVGPVFPTPAKFRYGAPLGLDVAREAVGLPGVVVFIGGICPATLGGLIAAGGRRVAAIGALQSVQDITLATRQMQALLSEQAN
jgi:thiamine-phosphate pyrophosphorylase